MSTWSECNDRTSKKPVISTVYKPSAAFSEWHPSSHPRTPGSPAIQGPELYYKHVTYQQIDSFCSPAFGALSGKSNRNGAVCYPRHAGRPHASKGCAVGTTMTLQDRAAPGLVGADISWGMEVFKISGKRLKMQKLDKLIRERIPSGRTIRAVPHHFADRTDLNALHCSHHRSAQRIPQNKALYTH